MFGFAFNYKRKKERERETHPVLGKTFLKAVLVLGISHILAPARIMKPEFSSINC